MGGKDKSLGHPFYFVLVQKHNLSVIVYLIWVHVTAETDSSNNFAKQKKPDQININRVTNLNKYDVNTNSY